MCHGSSRREESNRFAPVSSWISQATGELISSLTLPLLKRPSSLSLVTAWASRTSLGSFPTWRLWTNKELRIEDFVCRLVEETQSSISTWHSAKGLARRLLRIKVP